MITLLTYKFKTMIGNFKAELIGVQYFDDNESEKVVRIVEDADKFWKERGCNVYFETIGRDKND